MRIAGAVLAALFATQAVADECTKEKPCTPGWLDSAHKRVEQEKTVVARLATTPATEQNINTADKYDALVREWVTGERDHFGEWCGLTAKIRDDLLKQSNHRLTSEDIYPQTGRPDEDAHMSLNGLDGRVWTWHAAGPFSGDVVFGVVFAHPTGSDGPWYFVGCNWCVAGSKVMPRGCQDVPWKP